MPTSAQPSRGGGGDRSRNLCVGGGLEPGRAGGPHTCPPPGTSPWQTLPKAKRVPFSEGWAPLLAPALSRVPPLPTSLAPGKGPGWALHARYSVKCQLAVLQCVPVTF